jgi:hypothetical protein
MDLMGQVLSSSTGIRDDPGQAANPMDIMGNLGDT